MAPNSPTDLSKLTVPQLRALCKERRITGYSKLSKAVLLQKLADVAVPTTPPSSVPVASPAPAEAQIPTNVSSRSVEPSTTCRKKNVANQPCQPVAPASTETSFARILPSEPPRSSQKLTSTSTTSRKPSGTKRPAHIDISASPKRTRTILQSASTASRETPPPRASNLQQKVPVDQTVFKVPELPARLKESRHDNVSTLAKQPSAARKSSAARQSGRFKRLVPKPAECIQSNQEPSPVSVIPTTVESALASNFCAAPLPVLSHISLPPKASERKWVYRWAIILSAISQTDRQTCTLVSRTFRYAVYLSATHILSRNYAGRRLDAVLEQHPKNMTNCWPYLRFRTAEVSERRQAFERSFLGRYTQSIGYRPLSQRLWTSPDDEKQVDVAIRFVLSRMWFAISVGTYGHDASTWSRCVVQDALEVVKGEIWQVITRDDRTGESCSFYVLEATCEVIGLSPSLQGGDELEYRLRVDWSAWISQRSLPDTTPCSLLEIVKWSNAEEYHLGISKAWLRRVHGQDADSVAKRIVAARYILACVVANGISGQWMSTSAMAQEFAGLSGNGAPSSRTAGRSANAVNLYLAAHHHVESVHFTTSKGEALHGAVAVVQTPGREYYVLRDNGMQVGCEEEGIPEVWQRILGCDTLGRVRPGT